MSSAQLMMLPKDTSCSWESEEFEYFCSDDTPSIADTGQFIVVLALLVLILILLALCKMCDREKEKLDRLREEANKVRIATSDSIDIELENVKTSTKEGQDAVSHFDTVYI